MTINSKRFSSVNRVLVFFSQNVFMIFIKKHFEFINLHNNSWEAKKNTRRQLVIENLIALIEWGNRMNSSGGQMIGHLPEWNWNLLWFVDIQIDMYANESKGDLNGIFVNARKLIKHNWWTISLWQIQVFVFNRVENHSN